MYKWVFSERLKMSGDEHRRIASGSVFQARGPATAKARSPSVERRSFHWQFRLVLLELRRNALAIVAVNYLIKHRIA